MFQSPVLAPCSSLSDYCLGITSWQFFTGYLFMPSSHSWYDQPRVLFHHSLVLYLTYHYWLAWSFWTNCALFHDSRHETGVFPAVSSPPPPPDAHASSHTSTLSVWQVHPILSVSIFSAKLSLTRNYMLTILPLYSSLSFVHRSLRIIIAWLFFSLPLNKFFQGVVCLCLFMFIVLISRCRLLCTLDIPNIFGQGVNKADCDSAFLYDLTNDLY